MTIIIIDIAIPSSVYLDRDDIHRCFHLSSLYDITLKGSRYTLSLKVDDPPRVNISQQILTVDVIDSYGIMMFGPNTSVIISLYVILLLGVEFISVPKDISTGIGKDVFLPCMYNGLNITPIWNIMHADGTIQIASIGRLPAKHFSNSSGLIIRDIDNTQNGSSYSCFLQAYDKNKIVCVSSPTATINVLETIYYDLKFYMDNNNDKQPLNILEGESGPIRMIITRSDHSIETTYTTINAQITMQQDNKCKSETLQK